MEETSEEDDEEKEEERLHLQALLAATSGRWTRAGLQQRS